MNIQPINLTREDFAKFLPDPRTVREFENLAGNSDEIATTVMAIQAVPLVGLVLSDVLTDDRLLTGGPDIVFSDGGAKGSLTFGLTDSGVSAATYGAADRMVSFDVDAKGRMTLAADYELNSDNMTEGVVNLFYTDARARAALSGGTGIDYDSGTGSIALADTAVSPGTYGDANHVGRFTVDQQGRLTTASSVAITIAAVAGATPAPDGTYANPTSITIVNGIVTAIS